MRFSLLILSSMMLILATGCIGKTSGSLSDSNEEKGAYGPSQPSYKMEVLYDSTRHEISGNMHVHFTNNVGHTLNEVYFNIWPKADDFQSGNIDVTNVKYNGKEAVSDVNQTHLKVSGFSLPTKERAEVEMEFTVKVPEQQDSFGWDGTSVSLGNWFPILAVYDHNGWNVYPYLDGAESFYSLTGNYDVTITTDEKEVVAATGEQKGDVKKKNGMATYRFIAENVRDFAIQMNADYRVATEIVDDIKMNVYYTADQEKEGYKEYMLDSGSQALQTFNKKIGRYAWNELDIVGMECDFDGMEYPQLVMICLNEELDESDIKDTVSHEIGHQWFYSAVGNNQYKDPWLDESFASFMEVLGTRGLKDFVDKDFQAPVSPYQLDSPSSAFIKRGNSGKEDYIEYIYNYGLKTLNDLRIKLGDAVFYDGMQQYYQEMKYKITTAADFISIMEDTAGEDLTDFFEDHYIKIDD
ncbi:M1 family metallopeptidase [Oceanobacillus sojae]|uniref:M1 family metallopeptidase n=1 Tax=Oceanobacillus sojae TaxID=582851 RepID=UPI0021A280E2|nr:M1 family metallopeptidase [Oceanobacillus sojae]MCT1903870.1 M1 family metallopeptidase [Oceanobacillus sojae]